MLRLGQSTEICTTHFYVFTWKTWHIPPLANYNVCKWANVTPCKPEGLHLRWCVIDDSPHDTFVRCKMNTFSSVAKRYNIQISSSQKLVVHHWSLRLGCSVQLPHLALVVQKCKSRLTFAKREVTRGTHTCLWHYLCSAATNNIEVQEDSMCIKLQAV